MPQYQTDGGLPPRSARQGRRKERRGRAWRQFVLAVIGVLACGTLVYALFGQNDHSAPPADVSPANRESAPQAGPSNSRSSEPPPVDASRDRAAAPRPDDTSTASPASGTDSASASKPVTADARKTMSSPATAVSANSPAVVVRTDAKTEGTALPTPKTKVVRHVVKPGETLFSLSRRYYGHNRSAEQIARYNGIGLNEPLSVGKVLYIPGVPNQE